MTLFAHKMRKIPFLYTKNTGKETGNSPLFICLLCVKRRQLNMDTCTFVLSGFEGTGSAQHLRTALDIAQSGS